MCWRTKRTPRTKESRPTGLASRPDSQSDSRSDRNTDGQTDREAGRHAERRTSRQNERQRERQADRTGDRYRDRQKNRDRYATSQTERQPDSQTRQKERQEDNTDRQGSILSRLGCYHSNAKAGGAGRGVGRLIFLQSPRNSGKSSRRLSFGLLGRSCSAPCSNTVMWCVQWRGRHQFFRHTSCPVYIHANNTSRKHRDVYTCIAL